MKRLDDEFLALYNLYETDVIGAGSPKENNTTYQGALRKAGLKRAGGRVLRWILPLAAVLAATGLFVAAAYYRASDAFRGVLDIQPAAEVSQSAPSAVPVLDRAGLVVGGASQSGNVSMTLRAVAGDDRELKVMLDVEDRSGKPLAVTQADGTLSDEYRYLNDFALEPLGEIPDSWGWGGSYEFIETGAPHRMGLLLTYSVDGVTVRGETFRISIGDIMQFAVMEGTALDMEPDALYDIVSGFAPVGEDGYRLQSYSSETGYGYQLTEDSGRSVPLSVDSSLAVTNASVWDGALHLRGTMGSEEESERLLTNTVLVNATTGERVELYGAGEGDNDDIRWTANFKGFDTLEDLKGFVWYYGEGYGGYPVAEGRWEFTFTVDVEDMGITLTPDADARWEGFDVHVDKLEIGPLSLSLHYSVDEAVAREMFPETEWGVFNDASAWEQSDKAVTLTMKDGSALEATGPGYMIEWSPDGMQTDFTFNYTLQAVIEPEQVVSLTVGDLVIPVGDAQAAEAVDPPAPTPAAEAAPLPTADAALPAEPDAVALAGAGEPATLSTQAAG